MESRRKCLGQAEEEGIKIQESSLGSHADMVRTAH
jgi:hypothetical protein